jgi:hypothetical protein
MIVALVVPLSTDAQDRAEPTVVPAVASLDGTWKGTQVRGAGFANIEITFTGEKWTLDGESPARGTRSGAQGSVVSNDGKLIRLKGAYTSGNAVGGITYELTRDGDVLSGSGIGVSGQLTVQPKKR